MALFVFPSPLCLHLWDPPQHHSFCCPPQCFTLVSFCLSARSPIAYLPTLPVFLPQPLLPAHTPDFLPTTSVTCLPTPPSVSTSLPVYNLFHQPVRSHHKLCPSSLSHLPSISSVSYLPFHNVHCQLLCVLEASHVCICCKWQHCCLSQHQHPTSFQLSTCTWRKQNSNQGQSTSCIWSKVPSLAVFSPSHSFWNTVFMLKL